ncbi:hypothetical protein GA0116948_1323 [Chitinophaga costaii]|uniref:Lipoprotein n=1 Tax=Chitinophaga costaii TaxID=1335309 RepID=A0A1C4G956_9BACT|nr:hypothetical protein [Chitinophaga costaii]PUZ19481.1 hypothetical protein DCM91_20490 [Chitinophaga costaii]SCC64453.1 hypothetical protein GA0116948_1323 [Chitinophaga costaii]
MRYILLFFVFFLYSCSSKINALQKVYNNKEKIIKMFSSKSIVRSRGQNIIFFSTHNNNITKKYFFVIDGNKYHLTDEKIEYTPDILGLKDTTIGSKLYNQELTATLTILVAEMDRLDIRDITSDLKDDGIGFKIYLKDFNGTMIYVPDLKKLRLPYWKTYINGMNKFDDNWYYTLNN